MPFCALFRHKRAPHWWGAGYFESTTLTIRPFKLLSLTEHTFWYICIAIVEYFLPLKYQSVNWYKSILKSEGKRITKVNTNLPRKLTLNLLIIVIYEHSVRYTALNLQSFLFITTIFNLLNKTITLTVNLQKTCLRFDTLFF